ncbi:MAG: c-type cytochrome [Ferruginibacter sp.]
MFKKILKWTLRIIGSFLLLAILFYTLVYFKTEARANKVYTVNIQKLVILTDSASLKLGAHVAGVRGCNDCHANGGVPFFDDKNPLALLHTSNLTTGKGGINYTDTDWIRAFRHGLGKDGKSLWFMPVQHTSAGLSNKELGALIGYLKQLPPVNNVHPKKEMKPLGRLLTFLGKFDMFPAEILNHNAIFADEVKPEITAAYGKYLAISCQGCHGNNFRGGPGHGPGEPDIANLTQTGHLGHWGSDQFITAMQTGKTPEGKLLSDYMPWKSLGKAHNKEELQAIFLYLKEMK